jgi:hypothetical protein
LEASNSKAIDLLEQIESEELLYHDLEARFAVNRSTAELFDYLNSSLPDTLWVESARVTLTEGKEWGREDQQVPVIQVAGRAEDDVRAASQAFSSFVGALQPMLAGGDQSLQSSSNPRGKVFDWSLRAQLLEAANVEEIDEEEGR